MAKPLIRRGCLGHWALLVGCPKLAVQRQQVEQEQMLDMRQKRIAGLEQEEKDRAAQEAAKLMPPPRVT
jgi:hypothetical protein